MSNLTPVVPLSPEELAQLRELMKSELSFPSRITFELLIRSSRYGWFVREGVDTGAWTELCYNGMCANRVRDDTLCVACLNTLHCPAHAWFMYGCEHCLTLAKELYHPKNK